MPCTSCRKYLRRECSWISSLSLSIYLSVCLSVYLASYLSYLILSYHLILSYLILSYLSIYLSIYLILSYLTLYYLILFYLSIYLSMYLSIYLPTYLPIYLSIYLSNPSIYPSVYLCLYVSMYLCIYLSMYQCIYLSMYQCIYVSMSLCYLPTYLSVCLSIWFCQQETATQDARHKRIASAILVVQGCKLYTSIHTPMGQSDGDCHWSWVIFWSPFFSWPQDHNSIYSSKTTRVWNSRSLQKLNRKPEPGQFILVLEVMKPAMNICNVSLPCLIATVFLDSHSPWAPSRVAPMVYPR